jgi:energy-coupling factor transporter ATP-binding protein EcfA2
MSKQHAPPRFARSNPFSTRFVRPGAIPYLFEANASAEQLVETLRAAEWRGQVVGPHGSGKSTLLKQLAEALAAAGRTVWTVALHDNTHRLPHGWARAVQAAGANLIVIDGYEQLSRVARGSVRWHCRRHGWGLLVTAHADVGLATVHVTSSRLETAQTIAADLQQGCEARVLPEEVAECFAAANGEVRETLFLLYDRWHRLQAMRRE